MPDESTNVRLTLLGDRREEATVTAVLQDERVLLSREGLRDGLGWELKPEGFCKEDMCVPLPDAQSIVNERGIDLEHFAALLGRPFALDLEERTAFLGVSARDRGAALTALEAPDFALPDLEGRMHTLSEHRGKKVFLVAWASW